MAGFALRRNGSCLSSETECNLTIAPFYACCPFGTICSNHYNQVCCPTTTNCTLDIVETPVCGNSSWNLFNNGGVAGGYFCCLGDETGYSVDGYSDGCASPGYVLQPGEQTLEIIPYARSSNTSTWSATAIPNISSTAMTPSASNATTLTIPPSASTSISSINTPSLIGGILGGLLAIIAILCVVIIMICRRSRRARVAQPPRSPGPLELSAGSGPMELVADKKHPRELLSYSYRSPQRPNSVAELDASLRRSMLEKNESKWRNELPADVSDYDE